MNIFNIIIALWPLVVSGMAVFFYRKQNSRQAWTGGPISWPKSFWLAYTTTTWFFLPFVFIFHPDFPAPLIYFFVAHLLSWWIRGPLELVMIYKWLNWTPRYGISHDLFHILLCGSLLTFALKDLNLSNGAPLTVLALIFAGMIIFATCAEILFAFLFLKARSTQEEQENIYFASDDPKWIFINRVTLTVVIIVMIHLLLQSGWIIKNIMASAAL